MAGGNFALWLVVAAVAWWQGGPVWAVLPVFFAGYWLGVHARDETAVVVLERDLARGVLVVTGFKPADGSYVTIARDDEGRIIATHVEQRECDARRRHKEVLAAYG